MKKLSFLVSFLFSLNLLGQTVYKTPKSIEFAGITVNLDEDARQIVQKDVNMLMSSRRAMDIKLERMVQYMPIVEAILSEEDVPADFKYLVVQESSLMPDAISTSNAVGFWQFKKETAGDFGLRIDTDVDERKSIHASTKAAALYLKKNNQILNNWVSALYSYRLGLGGIRNLVPKEWAYASEIKVDNKTDWYVLRSLAHKLVFERELADYKPNNPIIFFEYRYCGGKTISQIAEELAVEEAGLRQYNRWLSTERIPDDKEYVTLVPVTQERFAEVKSKALTLNGRTDFIRDDVGFPVLKRLTPSVKNKNLPIFYQINGKKGIMAQEGDTPSSLAEKAKMDFKKFMTYNDLKPKDRLMAGEVYYLAKKTRKAQVPFHTVKSDQTLWKISQMYGIRLKNLLKFNRIEQVVKLQPGRVLWLRKKRPKSKPVEYIQLPPEVKEPVVVNNDPPKNTPTNTPKRTKPGDEQVVVPDNSTKLPPIKVDKEKEAVIPEKTEPTKPEIQTPNVYPAAKATLHTVAAGQTYYSIARQYNVSVQDIYQWNNIDETVPLKTGQKLLVKHGGASVEPTNQPESPKTESIVYHEVQKGDTLFNISKRYGISPEQIQEWNGLKANSIAIGQKLIIRK